MTHTIVVEYVCMKTLLGFPTIKALSLLSHVESVDKSIVSQYPSLFTGLGTFAQEDKI